MSASLPHRTLASIRTGGATGVPSSAGAGSPGADSGMATPHTPLRSMPSTFASPSSIRAEEDLIVIELGARGVRVGFAGDTTPKATIAFTPEAQRRAGDYRALRPGYNDPWQCRGWTDGHELWRFDVNVRDVDLGLVGDRIERALREAFTKFLLIDSKPRKAVLAIPSSTPIPNLSTILDTLFIRFQPPMVSLLSSATMVTVAAGQRSALVIDIGWAEAVVTAVYEYREVRTERSVRAGKFLVEEVHKILAKALGREEEKTHLVSFIECDEVAKRMVWCKEAIKQPKPQPQPQPQPKARRQSDNFEDALETVAEEDEEASSDDDDDDAQTATSQHDERLVNIPLNSTTPPTTITVPFDDLASPAEATFFPQELAWSPSDDQELSLPQLIYRTLLLLPTDVRATTMSRLVFTGGCSQIPGLRGRVFDELSSMIAEHGWDGVRGRGYDAMKSNKTRPRNWEARVPPEHLNAVKQRAARAEAGDPSLEYQPPTSEGDDGEKKPYVSPAFRGPEDDPVDNLLAQKAAASGRSQQAIKGQLRAIDSLGPWSGASLTAALKVLPIACVDREIWFAQGAVGASRPSDVDAKAQQRQSMGAGGLIRNIGSQTWTLGAWGTMM
ncbi:actin-like ATPase domain-containing protein [Zalerion maritima]|uniref:Actin-like ATPase domain-containing protein n=1 Tax=Zalerion maritima TaxID=339359 RepID=A0AAD5RYK4_9PEZI|nr:actin-like ATPase domain-containing protein [Zalerion maritima]